MSKKHVFKTPNSEYVNGNRDSNFQRNYKKCMKVISLMRTIDYVLKVQAFGDALLKELEP